MPDKKKGGRKANPTPGRKVHPTLSADAYKCLEYLASLRGRYGANPTEVAHYMIRREIDDLTRVGVIPRELPPGEPETVSGS